MLKVESFYKHILKMFLKKDSENELINYDQNDMKNYLCKNMKCFPHFPDTELISNLSLENYERKNCVADMIFLPFKNDINSSSIAFTYANPSFGFDDNNRRLIRKLLESLDSDHALVLTYSSSESKYYVRGIVEKSKKDELFDCYYFISILGYLKWSARSKNFDLFDYDTGKYLEFDHYSKDQTRQISDVVDSFKVSFPEINTEKLRNILDCIAKLKHGTSLVVFDLADDAKKETDRLCQAGRGFAAREMLSCDELSECITQFTKIDGGLLLDKYLNCYSYGCIYDGEIGSFKGSLERGSRYNSTKLYVHRFNKDGSCKCIGIVLSDDGGVEYVK